jgi:hypothetical protein
MKLLKQGIIMSRGRVTTAVEIYNDSTTANITNVTVGGVTVSDVTFPITAGNSAIGITTKMGTFSVGISYNNASGNSIEIEDTNTNITCANALSTSRIFAGQITNGINLSIIIVMQNGSCP